MTATEVRIDTGKTIPSLFQTRRPIDRPIEKVIDYYVTDEARLRSEVEEHEVTDSVERNFRRFLDVFGRRSSQRPGRRDWHLGFRLLWLRQKLVHQVSRFRARLEADGGRASLRRPAVRAAQQRRRPR
jgi:hypothetical protein